MRYTLGVIVALLPSVAFAKEPDYSIEMLRPYQGLVQCQVSFNSTVPSRAKVDDLMSTALVWCRKADQHHDIQVMGFHHDGVLEEGQATYAWLTFHQKLGCVQRVTFAEQFSKNLRDGC